MAGRSWDLPDWYAAPGKAERLLNWTAKTDLATGLKLTSEWIRSLEGLDFATMTKRASGPRRRSISAIVACYKDEQAIPIMHRRLTETFRKLDADYEIIFVNDGSPDDCAGRILEISATDPHVLGITHSRNFGSQMAFRSGMEMSVMQACVLLDGDLQDPPELIEQFYHQMDRRLRRRLWATHQARHAVCLGHSVQGLLSDLCDVELCQDSLRRRRFFVDRSKSCGLAAALPGARFVPAGIASLRRLPPDRGGLSPAKAHVRGEHEQSLEEPRVGKARHLFVQQYAAEIALRWRDCPARLSFALGIIVTALRIWIPDIAPRGATTLLLASLFFGAINLFAVGLVGEYIAKIMEEVKARPRLIRAGLIRNGETSQLLPDESTWP